MLPAKPCADGLRKHRISRKAKPESTARPPSAAPTPTPAFAPVLSPLEEDADALVDMPVEVLVDFVVDETSVDEVVLEAVVVVAAVAEVVVRLLIMNPVDEISLTSAPHVVPGCRKRRVNLLTLDDKASSLRSIFHL